MFVTDSRDPDLLAGQHSRRHDRATRPGSTSAPRLPFSLGPRWRVPLHRPFPPFERAGSDDSMHYHCGSISARFEDFREDPAACSGAVFTGYSCRSGDTRQALLVEKICVMHPVLQTPCRDGPSPLLHGDRRSFPRGGLVHRAARCSSPPIPPDGGITSFTPTPLVTALLESSNPPTLPTLPTLPSTLCVALELRCTSNHCPRLFFCHRARFSTALPRPRLVSHVWRARHDAYGRVLLRAGRAQRDSCTCTRVISGSPDPVDGARRYADTG